MTENTLIAWAEKRPPHQHFIMANYSVMEPLQLFKTCRSGCCVDDGICGPMALPRYWRNATPEEQASWPPTLRKAGLGRENGR